MKTIKYTAAAVVLSVVSFGAFAAQPAATTTLASTTTAAQTEPSATWHATDIEAGSNIQPAAQSTGRSMDDAFDVHTLVAGEWY
ncbi:hypothetical protein FH968_04500 [Buttiauxella sp. B2]|uniref:hypothetical protein n=1 Tax=Buttiauxella sp. B2 TaxID=2587812 RepID=UPI00111D9BDE|nr:hypothetical protein [Buttiauxella sp. B2]TNV22138.1 hypothetical protein FH968_04500 [Buttiauxella sp. B2]